jgi:hypothetical protein
MLVGVGSVTGGFGGGGAAAVVAAGGEAGAEAGAVWATADPATAMMTAATPVAIARFMDVLPMSVLVYYASNNTNAKTIFPEQQDRIV